MSYIKNNWELNTFQKGDKEIIQNLNHMETGIAEAGGGGSEPAAYLKSASVADNTLTLTNKDDTTVTFTPEEELPTVTAADNGKVLTVAEGEWSAQPAQVTTYTAGNNIDITNNVISAVDTTYTAGSGINISADKVITNQGVLSIDGRAGTITGIATSSDLRDGLAGKLNVDDVAVSTTSVSEAPTAASIKVGESYYNFPSGGTTVVANPTLAGTEAQLTGLQVGTTKYKVSDVRSLPSSWPISGTCEAFLQTIGADTTATVGKTYQGGIEFSDLHDDLGLYNAEAEVEIISSTLSTGYKVIWLNIYSTTNEPYHWSRIYWWRGTTASSELQPWLISARLANQYTVPVATGTCNNTTGVVTLDKSLSAGVYLISMYGAEGGTNTSRTYYFAYANETGWMAYSSDCMNSRMSALNGSLTFTKDGGTGPGWDADPTVEVFKMR